MLKILVAMATNRLNLANFTHNLEKSTRNIFYETLNMGRWQFGDWTHPFLFFLC
jgi:hypothetical protein